MKLHLTLATVTTAALLAGCAVFQPPPLAVGQTEAQVQALLGGPTARYAMPDGSTRLEFATGPYGRQTWMVDLGPDGRSRAFRQVLEQAGHTKQAKALRVYAESARHFAPLDPSVKPIVAALAEVPARDSTWKLLINDVVEVDA
jgi:hypothetical protein